MNVYIGIVLKFLKKLISAKKPYSLHRMYKNHHPNNRVNLFVGLISICTFFPLFFKLSSEPFLLVALSFVALFFGVKTTHDKFIIRTLSGLFAFILFYAFIFGTLKSETSTSIVVLLLPYIISAVLCRIVLNKTYLDVSIILLSGLIGLLLVFTIYPIIWISLLFALYVFYMFVLAGHLLTQQSVIKNKIKPSLTKSLMRMTVFAISFSLMFLIVTHFSFENHHSFTHDNKSQLTETVSDNTFYGLASSQSTAFRFTMDERYVKDAPSLWYWKSEILYDYDGVHWSRPDTFISNNDKFPHELENTAYSVKYHWERVEDTQPLAVLDQPLTDKMIDLKFDGMPFIRSAGYGTNQVFDFQGNPYAFSLKVNPENPSTKISIDEALKIDKTKSPLTQNLSNDLMTTAKGDEDVYVSEIFHLFKTKFIYTVKPVPKAEHNLDQLDFFLTKSHRGACLDFATATIILLRDQHFPARLVTGYYGAHWNKYGKYWEVTQGEAHAWVEAWSTTRHEWVRLDPTAVVQTIESKNSDPDDWQMFQDYTNRLMETFKNSSIFNWGDFSKINIPKLDSLNQTKIGKWLLPLFIIVILVYVVQTFYRKKHLVSLSKKWLVRFEKKLIKANIPKYPYEGWSGYFNRVSYLLDKSCSDELSILIREINDWLYSDNEKTNETYMSLKAKVKKFQIKRKTS
jgi:hypothetical protein